jgi:hypothetical protein
MLQSLCSLVAVGKTTMLLRTALFHQEQVEKL